MPIITRGFRGRRGDGPADRVPPGQYVTYDFPVLSAGPTPHTSLDQWDFSIIGEVDEPRRWTWEEFRSLPSEDVTVDIHCVTGWTKLDTVWKGVSVDTLLDGLETSAEYVVQFCDGGYTTNLPLEDVTDGKAWVVFGYDGESLEPEHGGPARVLVPHLYFWKSAKWVRGLRLADDRRARLLGGQRLPQLRRSMAGTAVLGRLSWQVADVVDVVTETPRVKTIAFDVPGWRRTSAGTARRRPPDRRGRLSGAAQLLDRVCAGRLPRRAHRRAPRRRRGLPVPDRRAAAGDQIELRGPVGGYFVWEPVAGRAAAARRRRVGRRAAHGDDPCAADAGSDIDTRLLFSSRGWEDVIYRDELERLAGGGLRSCTR